MKILILTTNTNHHNFFLHKISEIFRDITVIEELDFIKPPYEIFHQFELNRDLYEKNLWKDIIAEPFSQICKSHMTCKNINDLNVIDFIKKNKFDVCVVFGTRKILHNLCSILPYNTFNLHGGDPKYYRGLDSHLWSIWHSDLNGLRVCIHRLNNSLDDGDIYKIRNINLEILDDIHQLRSQNTEICIKITTDLLNVLENEKTINCEPQQKIGRYYSFMPSVLKQECIKKFKNLKMTNDY